ncbi:TIGR03750 family conjugal transfer protein [Pseudomonas sp. RC4D1]|uniref:TIGR03750 family conjugal transfer protein n=1 Tax=Pseudomonas sp. RC4D1 TaxID=2834407 RepID=UPI001BCE5A3D|nr:TIGR03750 family conjugal transfer protein [Pseudomonas sp. RC4D1]MBS7560160.1 TIGR03750 family conjugal transfer protein [Pseudomonas sp. RC4D1]
MGQSHDVRPDGTVSFLPNRLNHHPVVVRGLTADELWICSGLSAVVGLAVGIALALTFSTIAMVPTAIVLAISIGVFAGGGLLRRQKRGRPDTWLYRQIQWWVSLRHPSLARYVGGQVLVLRSGFWSTRRTQP